MGAQQQQAIQAPWQGLADRCSEAWLLRQKTLGSKRRDIPDGVDRPENYLPYIIDAFKQFTDTEITIPASESKTIRCKVFSTAAFGYRKVTIERPLRLNFQASVERIVRLKESTAFKNLVISRKKDEAERSMGHKDWRSNAESYSARVGHTSKEIYFDRDEFTNLVEGASSRSRSQGISISVRRAILEALAERDQSTDLLDQTVNRRLIPSLRDTESVQLDYLDDGTSKRSQGA